MTESVSERLIKKNDCTVQNDEVTAQA